MAKKIKFVSNMTSTVDGELVPVARVGVEYRLLKGTRTHPEGQLFIGYVSRVKASQDKGLSVQIVRWVPGIYQQGIPHV